MRKGHRENASKSLGLMDDGISVGQVLPVLYPDLTIPCLPSQLLLDLSYGVCTKETTDIILVLSLQQLLVITNII